MSSPKNLIRIKILQSGRLAGFLARKDQGALFEYAADYLSDPAAPGIAFNLPKQTQPYEIQGYNLHPFFAGLLPEGLRLRAMIRGLKTSEDDLFTLFSALGSSCIGDVSPEDLAPQLKEAAPKLKELSFTDYFARLLKRSVANISGNDAFPGVQDKISSAMISMPINIAKHTKAYILKLNNKDFPHIVRNEHACLSMAKRCGLRVNASKIIQDKDKEEGLLVTRFDRVWNSSTQTLDPLHLEDACQFLNLYPSEKYRVSLRQIAEGLQKQSFTPEIDMIELISQYTFSYLIGNGDLHAKNVSLVRDSALGRVMLSPAYDLVSTLPYPLDQNMAIKIDGRDKNIRGTTILQFAERFQLNKKVIKAGLQKILKKFIQNKAGFFFNMAKAIADDKKQQRFEKEIERRIKDISQGL